jgi:TonB-dependent starch-binding outer membrane protein SusC
MKYKIKHILPVLLVVFGPIVLKAQSTELKDSIKIEKEKKVNVLYGSQKYDRFVGNMDAVTGDKLKNYPAMMVQEALAGQLPGVFMMQNNGNPGEDNFTSYIRGSVGGFIILVDGVERPLNPYDIEQIDEIRVLKDPVSKALYGGRISNGIIMVTTKRGKTMKSEFHAGVQRGVKMPTSLPSYLNSYDFATYYNQALANDKITTGVYDQNALDAYKNHTNPYQYPDVDYYGQFLNKSMDLTKISTEYYGGNESTKFYVHGGYQNEGSFEAYGSKPRQMQAYNLQGNLDSKFSEAIMLHANFTGYIAQKQYPGMYTSSSTLFNTLSSRYPNSYPIFVNAHDSVGGTSTYKDNPYGGEAQSGYIVENHFRMQLDLGLDVKLDKLLPGLSYKPNFSFDIYHKQNLQKINTVGIYSIASFNPDGEPLTFNTIQAKNLATSQSLGISAYSRNWGFTNTLSYQKEIGKHAIDADVVYYISRLLTAGILQDYKRENLGMRLNYNYAGKYTLEGVLNYCGSQNFAPDRRFKTYPALGAGWLISKEGFMKGLSFVDFLKINASWGVMGDGYTNNTADLWVEKWGAGTAYAFNTSVTGPTTTLNQVNSLNFNWPDQRETDISLEAVLFKNLSWKVSYFDYLQRGLLSNGVNIIPLIVGGGSFLPQTNFGKTGMRGIEAELSYKGKAGDFRYQIGTHLTISKSNLINVNELPDPNFSTVGTPADAVWGFQAIGKYTQADVDKIVAGTSTMALPAYMDPKALRAGNIIYKDVNNDKVLNKYDSKIIGNNTPRMLYGGDIKLSYKGFDLYAMVLGFGQYNRYLGNSFYQIYSTSKYSTVVVDGLPNGNPQPLLTTGSSPNDFQSSDYWVVNGGYLKLQNVSLSYTLPKSVTKALKMSDMKLFLYGTDLLTFSKIKDSDPEAKTAGLTDYPLFSTYALGVSISF